MHLEKDLEMKRANGSLLPFLLSKQRDKKGGGT